METIENFQNIDYTVADSSACDMPQCCMIAVNGRCIRPMTHFSKYCAQHTFGQYHASNKGCKYGISDVVNDSDIKVSDFTQCGKSVGNGMYCIPHCFDEPLTDDMVRCEYVLRRGTKRGQSCGMLCKDGYSMCYVHMNRMVKDTSSDEILPESAEEKELRNSMFDKLIASKKNPSSD